MGYAMDPDLNDKLDAKVKSVLKGTKMGEELLEPEEEEMRYAVFDSAVFDLVTAAQEIYCEGDTPLDDILEMLIESFKKLKGKEKELKEVVEDEDEDEKEEGDDK